MQSIGDGQGRGDLTAMRLDGPATARADGPTGKPVAPSPGPVVVQVVEGVRMGGPNGATIEVSLVPEELGRVRVTMQPGEAGLVVQVTAERPETVELLRRNVDLLAQELGAEGFEDLSFDFGADGETPNETPSQAETPPLTAETDAPLGKMTPLILPPGAAITPGRLDLRF